MRTFAFASLLLVAAGLEDGADLSQLTCGGCQHNIGGFIRCSSSSDSTRFPFKKTADLATAPADVQAEINFHGVSNATFMTVTEMRNAVTATTSWDLMFCGSYLSQYKDGDLPTPAEGAACVEEPTAAAILKADSAARQLYNSFGTSNGYPSSWAISKGEPMPEEFVRWGTGGKGDVPSNWCSSYMKYMLCSVAFPQIAMTAAERDAEKLRADGAGENPNTQGKLRPVELDSCTDVFDSCNRREPTDDETDSTFIHPALRNAVAAALEGEDAENAAENDFFCKLWWKGYGLAAAGPAIADTDEGTVQFEAASGVTASALLLLVCTLVQLAF
ncbi:hypothetical protein DIPPA_07085 [Diplonema papillatum]|nr:hypothetical protein DIPPA_07085 [Diplonema papillatum]